MKILVMLLLALSSAADGGDRSLSMRDALEAGSAAQLCAYASARKQCLAGIARERKYATLAGVVDKAKLYRYQEQARQIDEKVAELRAWMRGPFKNGGSLRVLPCSTPLAARLTRCFTIWFNGSDNAIGTEWSAEGDCSSDGMLRAVIAQYGHN